MNEDTMAPRENPTTSPPKAKKAEASPSHTANGGESHQHQAQEGNKSYYLRWTRITKSVQVASTNAGLLGSGSISKSFTTRNTDHVQTKVILNSISGYAAPGELLCIMGPSGSGR